MPESGEPRILAFDTAGAALSVAACHGQRVLAGLHKPLQRGHAEQLAPTIASVMETAGLEFTHLDAVATTVGPGSFTGLRTGLATAQGLSLATGLQLVGLDRFQIVAVATGLIGCSPLFIAFDSKAKSLYCKLFDQDGGVMAGWPEEGRNLSLDEVRELHFPPGTTIAGDGVSQLQEAGLALKPSPQRAITAQMVAAAAWHELRAGRTGWPPLPLYLAPPRAKLPKDGGRLRARR